MYQTTKELWMPCELELFQSKDIEVKRVEEEGNHIPSNEIMINALQGFGSQRGSLTRRLRGGRSRGRGPPRDSFNRNNAKCTYCGKKRYYEFVCRLRIANQGEKQPSLTKIPNNDGEGSDSQRRVDFSLISDCCLSAIEADAIVLDSGASRDMSGERSYFVELSDITPGSWPINGIGG